MRQVAFGPNEVKILRRVPGIPGETDDFWKDIFVAEVKRKPATVKMYYASSGGEEAFKRDVKILGRNVYVPSEERGSFRG